MSVFFDRLGLLFGCLFFRTMTQKDNKTLDNGLSNRECLVVVKNLSHHQDSLNKIQFHKCESIL